MLTNGLNRPSKVTGKVAEVTRTELVCGEKSSAGKTQMITKSTKSGALNAVKKRSSEEKLTTTKQHTSKDSGRKKYVVARQS